jgi:hypothetical protein
VSPNTLFDRLTGRAYAAAVEAAETASAVVPSPAELTAGAVLPAIGPASPWSEDNHLRAIVWAELTGQDATPLTRAGAMMLPPVARHRHLICGTGARCPLVEIDGRTGTRLDTPLWATRTDGELHPYHRMLWTLDDLIFGGWSVWLATRGAGSGPLLSAERIAPERWETDPIGRVLVDGEHKSTEELILIPGPHEGILSFGADAIRRSIDNARAASNAARNPSAYLELHYDGDEPLTDDEIDALIARWAAARKGQNGGVAFTGKGMTVIEHGTHESHLLIEGRNADAVDAARMMSNPAAMADATSAGASLTYETTDSRNDQMLDYGVSLYMDAVAARLSMDDIVPAGRRMAFDTTAVRAITEPATGPSHED